MNVISTRGNRRFFLLVLAAFFFIIPPGDAMAYKNQIDVSLSGVSGERSEPGETFDSSFGTFGLSYTRYFNSLESGASPHALREFLQHPTRLYVGLGSEGSTIEAQTRMYSDEESLGSFVMGGMYYLDKKDSTGFGLELRSTGGESEAWDGVTTVKEEYEGGALELRVFQYIGGSVRLELGLGSEGLRAEDEAGMLLGEYEQGLLSLGASAVLDKIWLSAHMSGGTRDWKYSTREQDVGHIDLTFGYYFNRQWGLLFGLTGDSLEEPFNEQSTGTFSVTGDHYFRENMHVSASLQSRTFEETRPGLKVETRESGLAFAFGALF